MDIERLTKSQIVLLTLLVSFVTSIATGIVTVTLIDQAPPAITQTVNRVVERTVEKVVPEGGSQSAAASGATETVVTTEKTIVVKEEDLITDSIEKNSSRIVRINAPSGAGSGPGAFLGLGAIVERNGLIATDATLVSAGVTYTVTDADGKRYQATLVYKSAGSPIALIKLQRSVEDTAPLSPIAPASAESLKLGQSVLSIGGRERVNVATGIISSLIFDETEQIEEEESKTVKRLERIDTNIDNRSLLSGSLLLNIFGEVVGINTSAARSRESGAYTPVAEIQAAVSAHTSSTTESANATESDSSTSS